MEKPKLITETIEYYNYFACRDYIKHKYDFADFEIKQFWQWLCEYKNVSNDSMFYLHFEEYSKPSNEDLLEVFEAFKTEFSINNQSVQFAVSW